MENYSRKKVIITLIILLLIAGSAVGWFYYHLRYRVKEVASSSQNGYEVTLIQQGEPGWIFGKVKGFVILSKGENEVIRQEIEVDNKGGNIYENNWGVKWLQDHCEVIIYARQPDKDEEVVDSDKIYLLYFNGKVKKTDSNERARAEKDSRIQTYADLAEIINASGVGIPQKKTQLWYESIDKIVEGFGNAGYTVLCSDSHGNMKNPDPVLRFNTIVENREKGQMVIAHIDGTREYTIYEFETSIGRVDITEYIYKVENGVASLVTMGTANTVRLKVTDNGYLVFNTAWKYTEKDYKGGNEIKHYAFRFREIDDLCIEYSRKYIDPVGFSYNTVFISDWGDDNWVKLDMYDLYDAFYQMATGCELPYKNEMFTSEGVEHDLPAEDFEAVIQKFTDIPETIIRDKTRYNKKENVYNYRPRTESEQELREYPSSEVKSFTRNEDGTLTLNCEAVLKGNDDTAYFHHIVVIRNEEDGGFKYLSNTLTGYQPDFNWYERRLDDDEWKSKYGE